MFMTNDDKLRDLHSACDPKDGVAEIDKDRLDLTAIVAVNSTRGIQDGYAVMERKS
jgi:hypothetical protein